MGYWDLEAASEKYLAGELSEVEYRKVLTDFARDWSTHVHLGHLAAAVQANRPGRRDNG